MTTKQRTYEIVGHPSSGEQFACRLEDGAIVACAGPCYYGEIDEAIATDSLEEYVRDYLSNTDAGDAEDDAICLQQAFQDAR